MRWPDYSEPSAELGGYRQAESPELNPTSVRAFRRATAASRLLPVYGSAPYTPNRDRVDLEDYGA
jgi:hypothetical protein